MNVDTGEIIKFKDKEALEKALGLNDKLVEVNESDMTEKQKEFQKVSLHDNKSVLGKLRIDTKKTLNGSKRKKRRNKSRRNI